MENSPGMGPLVSWGIFAAAVAGIALYYSQNSGTPAARRNSQQAARRSSVQAVEPQPKKEKAKKKSQPPKPKPAASTPAPVAVATDASSDKKRKGDDDDDTDMSNRMFAQNMARTQQGTKIGGGKKDESRVKTVRSSKVETKASINSTAPINEAPGDDFGAEATPTGNAGDVSDMLEPSAPAPTTLRVTGEQKAKPKKAAKKEEEVETKKQRQNRMKVEAKKIEREAAEKDRKAQEERQRRSAREARGEPARNGVPAKAPANGAWLKQTPGTPATEQAPAVNGNSQLLDTFDEAESTASSNGGMNGSSTAPTSNQSEEEQMRQAMQESNDEDGWATVAAPKKGKKKTSEESSNGAAPHVQPVANGATEKKALPPKPSINGKQNGFAAFTSADEPESWDP